MGNTDVKTVNDGVGFESDQMFIELILSRYSDIKPILKREDCLYGTPPFFCQSVRTLTVYVQLNKSLRNCS